MKQKPVTSRAVVQGKPRVPYRLESKVSYEEIASEAAVQDNQLRLRKNSSLCVETRTNDCAYRQGKDEVASVVLPEDSVWLIETGTLVGYRLCTIAQ